MIGTIGREIKHLSFTARPLFYVFSISGLVRSLCGYPGAPAHSSVQFSPGQGGQERGQGGEALEPGTIAEYSCDRGFELLGPARRVCGDNGTWSPQGIPFCGELHMMT